MNRINTGGVVKGGLLAGLVINVLEGVLYGGLIEEPWNAAMREAGMVEGAGTMAIYIIGALVIGLFAVWIYAAVRPRLGAGPGTAVKVGLLVWAMAFLWPAIGFMSMGIVPTHLLLIGVCWELVEVPFATVAGAWIYNEDTSGTAATVPGMPAAPEPSTTTTPPQPPTD